MWPIRPEPNGGNGFAAQGNCWPEELREKQPEAVDDPPHRAKLEHTIAVRRITGAVVATGVVFAADMPRILSRDRPADFRGGF